jgi:hypothetical protein
VGFSDEPNAFDKGGTRTPAKNPEANLLRADHFSYFYETD